MEADPILLTNAETTACHLQRSAEIVESRFGGFEFKNGYLFTEVAKKLYEPPTFIRALTLWCFLFFALCLFARDSTDVLIMKNGDHLTCEIKGLNGGVLYVGLPYGIQTLSVDWSQVASVQSKQLFLVKMEDGSVYRGIINTVQTVAGRPMEIEVAETQDSKVVVNSARIVDVAVTSEKFFQGFTGGVTIGAIYSKGNQSVQYNLSGLAAYPRERWAVQVGLSSNLSKATGTVTSTRNQVTLVGVHLLPWKNYFYGAGCGFLQSTEQGIGLQSTVAGGVGRYLKNTNRATISVLGGFGWLNNRYNPTFPLIPTQSVAVAMINTDVKLFTFNKTSLDLNAYVFPALSQPGRVYASTNASYYVKLIWNLSWNISFYGNWDTRPPGNLSGSDYGTTSGLTWTFGPSLRTTPTSIQWPKSATGRRVDNRCQSRQCRNFGKRRPRREGRFAV